MGQAVLGIAGRQYRISCRDGDEPRIEALGADMAARAQKLLDALGVVPEGQLLVMIALMLADELAEARNGSTAPAPAATPAPPMVDITRLTRIVERLESLAGA